jgi:hypothetical protein
MLLQGLGQEDVAAPAPESPAAQVANKIAGLVLLAFAAYIIWDQFQPGPGQPGLTIAGLGDTRATHRRRMKSDIFSADSSIASASDALERGDCVAALEHSAGALVRASAADAEARGSGDSSGQAGRALRLATVAHRTAVKTCVVRRH